LSTHERLTPQLVMIRRNLESLPEVALPEGCTLRAFAPGDEADWSKIVAESFKIDTGPDHFDKAMKSDFAFRPHRVLFVECTGELVATASAWYRPTWGRNTGYLHMVGVRPAHTGKRLGLIVSAAALRQMAAEGRTCAVLETDDFRIPALKTYLRLGFDPLLVDDNQRKRWRDAFAATGKPELCETFADILSGPVFEPIPEHTDGFDITRYVVRRKWHPSREHKGGLVGGGDMDAFGDESLYRPSELGRAGVETAQMEAGTTAPLALWFQAGRAGVPEGAEVRFVMRGQRPLGVGFQAASPEKPGFVELKGPSHCELAPLALGFRVERGELREGDRVQISGGGDGFEWTKLAGKREFKVVFEYAADIPQQRLPEPVVITVTPHAATRLEAILPCTRPDAESVRLHVTARDKFDNRAPFSAHIRVEGIEAPPTALFEGKTECRAVPSRGEVVRAAVSCEGLPDRYRSNPCVARDGLQLFVGDLHAHDFLSEAEGYTDALYRWAIEDRCLDFLSVSVQSHGWHDNETWTIAKYMNERFLDEGRFVTLLAFEWQHSAYGDKVVHFCGGDQPYLPVDDRRYNTPAKLYEALRASDAVVISHHPGYHLHRHVPGTDFDAVETDVDRLVEIWSMHGSSEGYDPADRPLRGRETNRNAMEALRAGLRIGFVAGSDTHSARPGGSAKEPLGYWGGLAAVWAPTLKRRDIFEALKARRTYALTGARIVLEMTVNDLPMGSEGPKAEEALVRINVWAPGRIHKVELMKNTRLLRRWQVESDEFHVEDTDRTGGAAFYHCRVTQDDGHLAVCSPVWVG